MPGEAEVILFAIRALTRINEQFRLGYADSTRSRELTFPLPNFPAAAERSTALSFYDEAGRRFRDENIRVKALTRKLDDTGDLTSEEDAELMALYREHKALILAESGELVTNGANELGIFNEDMVHLLTIRQWREGQDPTPSLLRRAAGTLVSIAVEYVVEVPGAWSPHTSRGQALKGFLSNFEDVDFVEDGRGELLQKLFVVAVETVRDHPETVTENKRWSGLLQSVAKDLYDSSAPLIAQGRLLSEKDRVRNWTQTVFRSVLKSTATTVFADPAAYLGVRGPVQTELVSGVSKALLAPLLQDGTLDPSTLFTADSLDRVVKAALAVVACHPEAVTGGSDFLRKLVSATSSELAQSANKLGPEMLPELVRLVLESSVGNLELLLPDPAEPHKHLVITAAKTVLDMLAAPPAAGHTWRVQFTSADAMRVLDAVTTEVAQNPAWLLVQAGGTNSTLGVAVSDVLAVLRKASPKLTRQTALAVLETSLGAVGRRIQFMEQDAAGRRLIGLAVEAVLAKLFAPTLNAKAAWVLARGAAVERVSTIVLDALAKHGVTPVRIEGVTLVLTEAEALLAGGSAWAWELLAEALEKKLAVA